MNNRCHFCNKKYGLIQFDYECGGKFCKKHKYKGLHNCPFDYDFVSLEVENIGKFKISRDMLKTIQNLWPNRVNNVKYIYHNQK